MSGCNTVRCFAGPKLLLSAIWNFCPNSETCSITVVHFFCFYQDIKFDVFDVFRKRRRRIDKCVKSERVFLFWGGGRCDTTSLANRVPRFRGNVLSS